MRVNHLFSVSLFFIISGCSSGGGGGGGGESFSEVACTSTANDSVQTMGGWDRIRSELNGVTAYNLLNLTRESMTTVNPLTMDYMVHESVSTAKALIVLIAGGQLTAGITGTGNTLTGAGGNFLVRSAHLFAAQGYRVVTIDRPSDALDYTGGLTNGWAYDSYRISTEHAVDLSQIINAVNNTNLPVVIAGTSRGSISAVKQHQLGSLLAISAPLTSGGNGSPIGSANVSPAGVSEPVHVSWHVLDGCSVTTPANAVSLMRDLPDAAGVEISGGFASASSTSECNADHYHGFPGIESCAVKQATDWIASELTNLPATRPVASSVADTTTTNTQKTVDLAAAATASAAGALTYSLPHAASSLGGTISIAGDVVTYSPPTGVNGIVDTFVYIVEEAGGGTAHNVVAVTINP